ncbi:MAG: hypothetical protein CMP86_02335 [Gammaproteobacteria bacterium]|nr:hypothetical protein [Gammaproteobacteria bacterium]
MSLVRRPVQCYVAATAVRRAVRDQNRFGYANSNSAVNAKNSGLLSLLALLALNLLPVAPAK